MRSMVEGARDSSFHCQCRTIGGADAPSTALRAVPLPRYRGAGFSFTALTQNVRSLNWGLFRGVPGSGLRKTL